MPPDRHVMLLLLGSVTAYSLCYMAQVPVLPYLTKNLGVNVAGYARLQTMFSALQCVGSLISGPFMDRYGGRALLLLSFGASIASYALAASASSVGMLYASRLPTLLQHAVLAARTMVTEMSSEDERAVVLGYVGMAMSVGFTFGPAAGGALASVVNPQATAWVAAAGSAVTLVALLLLLPAGRAIPAAAVNKDKAQGTAAEPGLSRLWEVLTLPQLRALLVAKLLTGLGHAVFQSMFSVLLIEQFNLDSKWNGAVLSYVGVIIMATQTWLVKPILAANGESRAAYLSCWAVMCGFAGLALSRSLPQVLFMLLPLSIGSLLFSIVNTSQITKVVSPSLTGTALAIDMSMFSGVRMVAPSIGAALLHRYGQQSIFAFGGGAVFLLVLLARLGVVDLPDWQNKSLAAQAAAAAKEPTSAGQSAEDKKAL